MSNPSITSIITPVTMEDDFDLDSFIANIEQTAPEEDPLEGKLLCQECGSKLEEEEDGNLACPVCCVQATNILQYDETELHHDEQGRPVYGQRVALFDRKVKHQADYGWAWSTDEAIAHILDLQLRALEETDLVPDVFRAAVSNMWLKYWLETVAPHIKDEYAENEMIRISSNSALKLRDIEVLFKVKDKIMLPLRSIQPIKDPKRIYQMLGIDYTRSSPDYGLEEVDESLYEDEHAHDDDEESTASTVSFDIGPTDHIPDQLVREFNRLMANDPPPAENPSAEQDVDMETPEVEKENGVLLSAEAIDEILLKCVGSTRNLSRDSVKILTLNRTLAFLEATSRCLSQDDPLFAADIIRACNQRLIPFYGSSKCLPENMKLTSRDRLMFQRTTPPTPIQLTRTASLLINNIYKDLLPKSLPVPDLDTILDRFVRDMNLPRQLMGIIHRKVHFSQFPSTQPKTFVSSVNRRLPQYDRWAFAVLVYHLKALFNLRENFIEIQKQSAIEAAQSDPSEKFFIMSDWIAQIKLRLDLILRHDPYVLYHPLCQLDKLEISAQLAKYVECQIEARAPADLRVRASEQHYEPNLRNELVDVLKREIKPPPGVKHLLPEGELEPSSNIKFPLTDAFERTKSIWSGKLDKTHLRNLVHQDFSSHQMLTLTNLPRWSFYDNKVYMTNRTPYISPLWPEAFKVLLDVGAFLCFCRPVELVSEIRLVEETLHPQTRVIRRSSRLSRTQKCPVQSYAGS